MQYHILGNTGIPLSAIAYGGIVSAGLYDGVQYPALSQEASDRFVAYAIERGVTYFDVAPSYGNAQLQLGNSLRPYRDKVSLACKTSKRDKRSALSEIDESLKLLHTGHFDVFQIHGVSSMEDVERAFGSKGIMEILPMLKDLGVIRHIGFSAHSEEAALAMIERYDFETVLFPFNWFLHMEYGMGERLLRKAKSRGMGVLAMKAFIERKWDSPEERTASAFPKSWCKPIDVEDEAFGVAAMKYALSLGVDTLIPPGNFESFSFAVEHIDQCLQTPLCTDDLQLLTEKLSTVRGKNFF